MTRPVHCVCIDDDPLALEQLKRAVSRLAGVVRCDYFGSPARALEAHEREPAELVLSDLQLGATTGLELVSKMHQSAPGSVYMLMSGEADLESALAAMNQAHVFRFLTKPIKADDIERGVNDAVRELNLRKMRQISNTTLDAIQKMNLAIAVVDLEGRIVYQNRPARHVIRDSGAFDTGRDDLLRSVDPVTTKTFLTFLETIAQSNTNDGDKNTFRFTRRDHSNSIVVSVIKTDFGVQHLPHFSLVVCDPARKNVVTAKDIAQALDLTPSEARVVHGLVDGASVEDAAKFAGVSVSTARTYLKVVFSKTGVSRQAELVRLALLTAA